MPQKLFCFLLSFAIFQPVQAQKEVEAKIYHLFVLPPIAKIYVINKINRLEYNDSLSVISASEILKTALKTIPDSVACHKANLQPSQKDIINDTVYSILKAITKKKKRFKKVQIPEVLLHYLDSLHQDFALCIVQEGFERSDENFVTQDKKAFVSNYFLGSFYKWLPNKSASIMTMIIIDREKRNIRYFKEGGGGDPTDKTEIRPALYDLFMSYFQTVK